MEASPAGEKTKEQAVRDDDYCCIKYISPLHIFFQYTRIMEKDLCRGAVYLIVLCDLVTISLHEMPAQVTVLLLAVEVWSPSLLMANFFFSWSLFSHHPVAPIGICSNSK